MQDDEKKAQKTIEDLLKRDYQDSFIEYLHDYYDNRSGIFLSCRSGLTKNYLIIFKALLNAGDHCFIDGYYGPLFFRMAELVMVFIKLVENEILYTEKEFIDKTLYPSIKQGNAILYQLLVILAIQDSSSLYFEKSRKILKRLWVDRVSELSKSKPEDFINHNYFLWLLYVWGTWSKELDNNRTEAEQFIKDYKKDDKNWPQCNHLLTQLTQLTQLLCNPNLLSKEICDSNVFIHGKNPWPLWMGITDDDFRGKNSP